MLIGNLTAKPELRTTANGINFSTFDLITNREWVSGGQRREEAMKHSCVAWDRLADICSTLLDKGNLVYVEGRLESHKFKDANEIEREKTEVVVNEMIRLKRNEFQLPDSEEVENKNA